MPDIQVTFRNGFGESRKWTIWDNGADPNVPPVLFDDYLGANETTLLALHSDDGTSGSAKFRRSDSGLVVMNVADGSTVDMIGLDSSL
jgi:hypothetical protein